MQTDFFTFFANGWHYFDFPIFLVLASGITGIIWLFDAIAFAPRRKGPEPIIIEYAKAFFPIIFVVLLLRSFLIEPFRIPSGSMMPTLLVGDFILVNKYVYGLRLPVLNTKVVEIGAPARGDVVVFRYPEDPRIDYIKRVVGVPGDHIEYRDKTLYINGKIMQQTPLRLYTGVGTGAIETGSLQKLEHLAGVEHDILIHHRTPDFNPNCQFIVDNPVIPPGHYFVMGDNRDNSHDGRCWGLVPDTNLVGKAVLIWLNWDGWFAWERIGRFIH